MDKNKEELLENLQELGHFLMHRSMKGLFQFAKKYNLSFSQLFILSRLKKWGKASVSEISEMLDISNSAVSQLLDKLVQSRYIERREAPDDRRKKYHYISKKGEEVLRLSIIARSSWMEELVVELSEEERAEMIPFLQKLNGKINDLDPLSHNHCYHRDINCGEENQC